MKMECVIGLHHGGAYSQIRLHMFPIIYLSRFIGFFRQYPRFQQSKEIYNTIKDWKRTDSFL